MRDKNKSLNGIEKIKIKMKKRNKINLARRFVAVSDFSGNYNSRVFISFSYQTEKK
jgi:hypothetical protein